MHIILVTLPYAPFSRMTQQEFLQSCDRINQIRPVIINNIQLVGCVRKDCVGTKESNVISNDATEVLRWKNTFHHFVSSQRSVTK